MTPEEEAAWHHRWKQWEAALLRVPQIGNVRIKHGEPYIDFVVTGPKGGNATLIEIDLDSAKVLMLHLSDRLEKGGQGGP